MKVFVKKISILLCAVLLLGSFFTSHNVAKASSLEQKYLMVQNKIITSVENNIEPTDIMENLTKDEVQVLVDIYSSSNDSNKSKSISGLNTEVVNNPEVKIIDEKASKYFDYYNKNGEFPIEIGTYSFTYSELVQEIGYTYTYDQIAQQLVAIANYIGLSYAFPFLNLIALLSGVGLLAFTSLVIAYSAVAVGANNLIYGLYINNYSELEASKRATAQILVQKEQGYEYWKCGLANYKGMGGIFLIATLDKQTAIEIAKTLIDQKAVNVLTLDFGRAGSVATAASRFGFTPDKPHTYDGRQPLNLWHVHPNVAAGVSGHIHIFYIA